MNTFLNKVVELYELLNRGASMNDSLSFVFDSFRQYVPFDRIAVALLDREGNIYSQAIRSHNKPFLKEGYSANLSETSLCNVIQERQCRILNDYLEHYKKLSQSEHTRLLLQEGIRAGIACPLLSNDICIGVMLFSNSQPNIYQEEHIPFAKTIANHMALSIEKSLLVDDLILASIAGFARLVEAKDSDTGLHLERMQNYSRILAQTLSAMDKYKSIINKQYIDDIFKFSPLHDIGKVGIADGILLKPAKLTPEEFEVMKKHTVIGGEVLRKASNNLLRNGRNYFDVAIQIAEGHHEKFNGKGYPHGLAGENIPLAARIVTVADVLDALTSKRVYKSAFDMNTSLQMLKDESGKSFDPDVVEAVRDSMEPIREIFEKYQEHIDLDRR